MAHRVQLPCYSGVNLHELESDEAMATTVDALIYMTRSRMGQIAWLLLELLEKLSKVSPRLWLPPYAALTSANACS